MKKIVFAGFLLFWTSILYSAQPPYQEKDPSSQANTDVIYNKLATHLHDGNGSQYLHTILPDTDSTYNLGASGREWANLYVDTITFTKTITGSSATLTGTITSKTITPLSGSTYNLGAPGNTWANVYADTVTTNFVSHSTFSLVIVSTGNGFGSTNTRIRRYTTIAKSVGKAITYADSSTNGASFTINQTGYYSFMTTDQRSGGGSDCGISVNSTQLTLTISEVKPINRLAKGSAGTGLECGASGGANLSVGDVVRPHSGGAEDDTTNRVMFRITGPF